MDNAASEAAIRSIIAARAAAMRAGDGEAMVAPSALRSEDGA